MFNGVKQKSGQDPGRINPRLDRSEAAGRPPSHLFRRGAEENGVAGLCKGIGFGLTGEGPEKRDSAQPKLAEIDGFKLLEKHRRRGEQASNE